MMPGIDEITAVPVPALRALLAPWVAAHATLPPEDGAALQSALQQLVDQADDELLAGLLSTFGSAGAEYRLYPAHPFARQVTRVYMRAMTPTFSVTGLDHLDAFVAAGGRRMIVCNHLSYTDTQITDSLFCLEGRSEVADRLVAIAGPKVYTDSWRRLAAISLNTRKTAQSSTVATEQEALDARSLAAVAFETMEDCARLMDEGWIILLYPEGTRSRTGRMGPFLRAAGRYLRIEGLRVLPMAQAGTDHVFPIDDPAMHPAHVSLSFGAPFVSADCPGRHGALETAWRQVAALLPEPYQPLEGTAPTRV